MATPFQADDLYLYQTITAIDCMPSLDMAACEVQSISREQDSASTMIWLVPLDGQPPRQFTSGPMDDGQRWSPDGHFIVFTGGAAEGDAQMRLWLYEVATEKVQPLRDEGIEVVSGENVYWSADSASLVMARTAQHLVFMSEDVRTPNELYRPATPEDMERILGHIRDFRPTGVGS